MKNSDQPVFPITNSDRFCTSLFNLEYSKGANATGLTKREYFAGLILQGIMSAGVKLEANYMNHFAQVAIMQADALLAELELSNQPTGANPEQ